MTCFQTNTFQCVLARSGSRSYGIFLYADGLIQWPTTSFGSFALAGYNAGDGLSSYTIPGSLTAQLINISDTTNVGVGGMWVFQFNEEITPCSVIPLGMKFSAI